MKPRAVHGRGLDHGECPLHVGSLERKWILQRVIIVAFRCKMHNHIRSLSQSVDQLAVTHVTANQFHPLRQVRRISRIRHAIQHRHLCFWFGEQRSVNKIRTNKTGTAGDEDTHAPMVAGRRYAKDVKRTYMVDGIIMTEYAFNLSAVRTAPGFLQLMSKELSFPGYFGGTFDAFEECFRDLAWLSDEHIVIHIRGLDSVAARNPMLAASIKESILFCADYWRSTKQIERDVQIELVTETQ